LVKKGESLKEAKKLGLQIAEFPQICMRNDRISVYEQFGLEIDDALKNEFQHGLKTLESGEYLKGSKKFLKGHGKHGKF
jgi:enoyl-CoA hydratase